MKYSKVVSSLLIALISSLISCVQINAAVINLHNQCFRDPSRCFWRIASFCIVYTLQLWRGRNDAKIAIMRMFISGYNRIPNHLNTLPVDEKIFVSAKKYLRKKKFPDTCGHGLTPNDFTQWGTPCSERVDRLEVPSAFQAEKLYILRPKFNLKLTKSCGR